MQHYPSLAVLVRIQAPIRWYTIVRERARTPKRSTSRQMAAFSAIIHLKGGGRIIAVITKIKISHRFALKIFYHMPFK